MKLRIDGELTPDNYHEAGGISRSDLLHIDPEAGKTPAHFLSHMMRKKKDEADQQTPTEETGNMYHMAVLQPDVFAQRTTSLTEDMCQSLLDQALQAGSKAKSFSKNLSTYQAWKRDCEAGGITILDDFQRRQFDAMQERLHDDMKAGPILRYLSAKERPISWVGPEFDIKALLDGHGDSTIYDLKTVASAAPDAFARAAVKYGWDKQAAFYLFTANRAGISFDGFTFIAQEKVPPYAVAVYDMPHDWIVLAMRKVQAMLATVETCLGADRWPSFGRSVLSPPPHIERELAQ